jgi:hypothetical protein
VLRPTGYTALHPLTTSDRYDLSWGVCQGAKLRLRGCFLTRHVPQDSVDSIKMAWEVP